MDIGGVENRETRARKHKRNIRLRAFASAYFATGLSGTEAALVLYPGLSRIKAAKRGTRLLEQAKEDGWIEHVLGKAVHAMQAPEVVARLSEQARADIGDFIQASPDGSFGFDLFAAKAAGKTHLIESLTHDRETGAPIVKLYSAQKAQTTLAKIRGLFSDAPPPAPPVLVNVALVLAQLSPEALRELAAGLAAVTIEAKR